MDNRNVSATVPALHSAARSPTAWLHAHRWFALFVVLPLALSIIYYGLIASDQFVSESRFSVKAPGGRSSQLTSLSSLIQTTGLSAGQEQAKEVMDYVRSRNALADLMRTTDVRKKFASVDADILSRYPGLFDEDRFDSLYDFYRDKIDLNADNETGLAVLSVTAFTPRDAHEMNAKLLDLSERLVNQLNVRARQKSITEGEKRVAEAEARVRQARGVLGQYRNSAQIVDPAKQVIGVFDVSNKMISEQAALQAQLETMERVTPRNPNIPALRDRIAAINRGIVTQNGRAVGSNGAIASKIGSYENLVLEQEFAAQMLTAANASLEQSRTEAEKQQFYLERVVEPNTPDRPMYPKRIKKICSIAGVLLCLYLIGWMLIVGILEHSPED